MNNIADVKPNEVIFIQQNSEVLCTGQIGKKILNISLILQKASSDNDNWNINGSISIEDNKNTKIANINNAVIVPNNTKEIGSWDPVFEKRGYCINIRDKISNKDIKPLDNQPLLKLQCYKNGMELKSNYLTIKINTY